VIIICWHEANKGSCSVLWFNQLLKSRSKELPSSNGMIDRLVMLTVETNGATGKELNLKMRRYLLITEITALTAVISLILFLGVPVSFLFSIWDENLIIFFYSNMPLWLYLRESMQFTQIQEYLKKQHKIFKRTAIIGKL